MHSWTRWRRKEKLRKLRKPGNREREKYFAFFFEFPIQIGRKFFSEKTEKTWRKRNRKGSATFLLHLVHGRFLLLPILTRYLVIIRTEMFQNPYLRGRLIIQD
jgi:hypothetical protein